MSDSLLIDSPPANDSAASVFKRETPFDGAHSEPAKVETPPVLAPEKPATPPPAVKKGPLDKMGKINKPEPPKEEPVVPPVKVDDKEKNWNLLRERAEKAEKELNTIKPEYEKIKPAYETTRQEFEALKAKGLNEEERSEFARLREMNAVEMVRNSIEYRKKLQIPAQKQFDRIQAVAKNANLKGQALAALNEAVEIPDDFQRAKAIRAIVKGEDLEPEDYQELANIAVTAANDLMTNWYPKMDEVEAQALEVQNAARAKQGQAQQEMSTKQKAELDKAHQDVYSQLSGESLKPLFDEPDLSVEGTTLADAMKNPAKAGSPQEMAAQEQLAAAAPFMIEHINRLLKKVFDLEQANKMRNGSAPNRNDGKTKTQDPAKEQQLDAKEVFQGKGMNFMGPV